MTKLNTLVKEKALIEPDFESNKKIIIKKISIQNFEDVKNFDINFDSQLALIPISSANILIRVINIILKSRTRSEEKIKNKEELQINAEVEIEDQPYFIAINGKNEDGYNYYVQTQDGEVCEDFFDMIKQNMEEENISFFDYDNTYSDRITIYKDFERYVPSNIISKITDGVGNTRHFHYFLGKFVKAINDSHPSIFKNYIVKIDESGKIIIRYNKFEDDNNTIFFDYKFYEYFCFVILNIFWHYIENTRNLNHIDWPVFLHHVFENKKEVSKIYKYLEIAKILNRQIFMVIPE